MPELGCGDKGFFSAVLQLELELRNKKCCCEVRLTLKEKCSKVSTTNNEGDTMKVTQISEARFEELRGAGRTAANRFYSVDGQIAWSTDGVGFFWYDTLAEAMEEHG